MKRVFVDAGDTDDRWRDRVVEVLARSKGRPKNALVEFDTGSGSWCRRTRVARARR